MKSNKTRLSFWLIAIALPFLFFVGLEWALRVAGFGKSMPLFMENPNAPDYMLPTPDVVKRYFHDDDHAPHVTIETNFFKKQKSERGLRLFVQGGSTAAGFPYGYSTSIAGMLDYRLKQSFPDREIEVVNTALSAVNSYTILDFVDEIIEQQPDAVLIYAGHNEYLGILGVGSAYTAANSRAATLMYLKLKDLRLFQLMQNVYSYFSSSELHSAPSSKSRTMMAKVAKHKNIPFGSELYQQGIEQFSENMQLVLAKYRKAGIPVFISTIASNLSHQKPFSSASVPTEIKGLMEQSVTGISVEDIARLKQYAPLKNNKDTHLNEPRKNNRDTHSNLIEIAQSETIETPISNLRVENNEGTHLNGQSKNNRDTHSNLAEVEQLETVETPTSSLQAKGYADIHFYLGQYYLNKGEFYLAKLHFEQAREHDLLRFRAPQQQNQTIKQLANLSGVYLIDAQQALENAAPQGLIGQELMIEHLHPTVKGYAVLANSFYQGLKQSNVLGTFPVEVSKQQAIEELPIFAAEKYWGEAKIAGLMADYPFTDKPEKPKFKAIKSWSDKLGFAAYKKQSHWLEIAQTSLKYARKQGDKLTQIKRLSCYPMPSPIMSITLIKLGLS